MKDRIKIKFPIEEGSADSEVMYAMPSGNGFYVLDNSPFYTFGISYCDEFKAKSNDGELIFDSIVARSGHSTYRIKLPLNKEHNYFLEHWTLLADLGCSYEGSSVNKKRLYSIDMPPNVDVFQAYKIMEDLENKGVWEFEEGHYCPPEESSVN